MELSGRESTLLEYFHALLRKALSREQILSAIWEHGFDPGSNSVDVYVRYLRNKLGCRGETSLIATVRGTGYRFDPADTSSP